MAQSSDKAKWSEDEWKAHFQGLFNRHLQTAFELGKGIGEFHREFQANREKWGDDWTSVCKRVVGVSQGACSMYEAIYRVLEKVDFRESLPTEMSSLYQIAKTYELAPETVRAAVESGAISRDMSRRQADQLYQSAKESGEAVAAEARSEKKVGRRPRIELAIERDIRNLYGRYDRALVDLAMEIKMFYAEILDVMRKWDNRWDSPDIIRTLKSHYGIVDEDLEEASAREAARARAEALLGIPSEESEESAISEPDNEDT